MRGVRRWQDEESPEMKTPATFKEQVKSHPLDVDSDSEVRLAVPLSVMRCETLQLTVNLRLDHMVIVDREQCVTCSVVLSPRTRQRHCGTVQTCSLNAGFQLNSVINCTQDEPCSLAYRRPSQALWTTNLIFSCPQVGS